MTINDKAKELAGAVGAFIRANEVARGAAVTRPTILDEAPPEDPARVAGWRARRDEAEAAYVEGLLGKRSLDVSEAAFLARELALFARTTQ